MNYSTLMEAKNGTIPRFSLIDVKIQHILPENYKSAYENTCAKIIKFYRRKKNG